MELNLVGQDKLKVRLSPFDMIRFDLTCDMMDYDNTETRKAVWSILDTAKHETGFDAAAGRIYIQVYPEKSGGCQIFITKLKKEELPPVDDMNSINEKAVAPLRNVPAVYQFEDADNLMRVCKFLARRGYTQGSDAFVETDRRKGHRYYLILTEAAPQKPRMKYLGENLFIGEFGTLLSGDAVIPYLHEHCKCFCLGDAVQTLSAIAK